MTNHFNGLILEVPDGVYKPEEDSYLIADSLKDLRGRVLDIGCGSGILSLTAAKTSDSVLGVDINLKAVEASRHNAKLKDIKNAEFILSDMFSNVDGLFDFIVFNPPYLPKSDDDPSDIALDGGKDGTALINLFIDRVAAHLKKNGKVHLLVSSFNDFSAVEQRITQGGFSITSTYSKKLFFEELKVFVFGF
jgi:release factor glutamine methyltransferase